MAGWEAPAAIRRTRAAAVVAVLAAVGLLAGLVLRGGDGSIPIVVESPGTPPPTPPTEPGSDRVGVWVDLPPAPVDVPIIFRGVWTGATPHGPPASERPRLVVWGLGGTPAAAYRPETTTWHEVANWPLAERHGFAAAWTGEEVIVWGGSGRDTRWYADGAAFDPVADRWRALPDAPLPPLLNPWAGWLSERRALAVVGLSAAQASVDDRRIHVATYDPEDDEWHELPDPPVRGVTRVRAEAAGPDLIMWGATVDAPATGFAVMWDDALGEWDVLDPPPLADAAGAAAVWTGSELVLWGRPSRTGSPTGAPIAGMALEAGARVWTPLAEPPGDRGLTAPEGLASTWTGAQALFHGRGLDEGLAWERRADDWVTLSSAPGAVGAVSAWTGEFWLLWGGYGPRGPNVDLRAWLPVDPNIGVPGWVRSAAGGAAR